MSFQGAKRLFRLSDEALATACRLGYDGEPEFVDDIELIRAELHRRNGDEPVTRADKLAHLAFIADEDMPEQGKKDALNVLLSSGILVNPLRIEGTNPTPTGYPEDKSLPDHEPGNI